MKLFRSRSPEQPLPKPTLEVVPSLPLPIEPEARPEPEQIKMVGELSVEYLQYLREQFRRQKGKFVRVGDVILLAPYIPDAGEERRVSHISMIKLASDNEELAQKIAAAKPTEPIPATGWLREEAVRDGVADAGWFSFTTNDSGEIESFEIVDSSMVYGMGGEAGRKETLKIAAQQLGPNIEIIWGDPH